MKKETNISSVILAGGKNKRFSGQNKALLEIKGIPLIERIGSIVNPLFNENIIVSNKEIEVNNSNNIIFTKDYYKGIGPLGGIHAALKAANTDAIAVFSCDMPLLNEDFINLMVNQYRMTKADILIPIIDGNMEPLHAIYSTSILDKLETYIDGVDNYKVLLFFDKVKTVYWNVKDLPNIEKVFTNINTLEEYNQYIRKVQ